jgi:uncharacterized membrane protein
MSASERRDMEEAAERVRRGATKRMILFGALFVIWQAGYFILFPDTDERLRNVDIVRTVAFLAWTLALLALFASGGAILGRRRLRPFIDDERAQAVRSRSYRNGFWAMTAVAFLAYVATMIVSIRAADLAHLTLSAGVLAALISQIMLDRD